MNNYDEENIDNSTKKDEHLFETTSDISSDQNKETIQDFDKTNEMPFVDLSLNSSKDNDIIKDNAEKNNPKESVEPKVDFSEDGIEINYSSENYYEFTLNNIPKVKIDDKSLNGHADLSKQKPDNALYNQNNYQNSSNSNYYGSGQNQSPNANNFNYYGSGQNPPQNGNNYNNYNNRYQNNKNINYNNNPYNSGFNNNKNQHNQQNMNKYNYNMNYNNNSSNVNRQFSNISKAPIALGISAGILGIISLFGSLVILLVTIFSNYATILDPSELIEDTYVRTMVLSIIPVWVIASITGIAIIVFAIIATRYIKIATIGFLVCTILFFILIFPGFGGTFLSFILGLIATIISYANMRKIRQFY